MRVALVFPGQGAQTPGFLRRLPQHPSVRATLDEAGQILGEDVTRLDRAEALESTVATQLGTVIAGVAMARALAVEGLVPDAVAGLSVGAFTAAVACEALGFADALRLVTLRAGAMAHAFPSGYGMAAIRGMSERDALGLIARVNDRLPLYLASVNAPTEVVVAGADAALAAAAVESHASGATAQRLRLGIPSHCPLMDPVSARLREAMRGIALRQPRGTYVSNHRARAAGDAKEVAEDLILNVSRPVRWHDSVRLLYELGCRLYVESPPGHVLSDLLRTSLPDARALALEEAPLATAVRLAQQLISRRGS
jgi:malonate decarboxylase epsilon subunit